MDLEFFESIYLGHIDVYMQNLYIHIYVYIYIIDYRKAHTFDSFFVYTSIFQHPHKRENTLVSHLESRTSGLH